ncbi:MAG: ABC transporter substrate-binding protein [Dehalococcoidia bacterium]
MTVGRPVAIRSRLRKRSPRRRPSFHRVARPLCAALVIVGCGRYQEVPRLPVPIVDVRAPLAANIRDGQVREYSRDIDYFPEKTSFRYSKRISIEYHRHYKLLTVTPAPNPRERFRYALVQRGTPAPRLPGDVRTIEVPVRDFILADDELLGAAAIVGLAARLLAISTATNVREPAIRTQIDRGRIVGIGSGKHVDVERVIQLQPDLVLTYWSVDPSYDAHPVLDQAGIRCVVLASHWEASLLASAEWMKVMAVLFNREAEANRVFDGIANRYERLAARARAQPRRPLLLTRLPFRHIWYLVPPPPEFDDAGGTYFWPGETRYRGVDIEDVVRRGRDADVWIIAFPTPIHTQDELLAREPRLALFEAVRRGEVWNLDRLEVERDRPWHDHRVRPDLVLADLVKILHPALVPDHELVFYRRLDPSTRFPLPPVETR